MKQTKIYRASKDTLNYQIRLAQLTDMPNLLEHYHQTRLYMIESGNPTQWQGYPSKEILTEDIHKKQLYILEAVETDVLQSNHSLLASFVFQLGIEPNYQKINGQWSNNELNYVTLHRVASNHKLKHTFSEIVKFALYKTKELYGYSYIRIDTHSDNKPMQAALKRTHFVYCGKIFIKHGGERLAYDFLA